MGYVNHLDRFRMLPGVAAAVARLNRTGLAVVVVSNQSGVGRGYFPEDLVGRVHRKMADLLAAEHAHLDGVYICPHHPEAAVPAYRRQCDCRKPAPGLFLRAAQDLHLDLKHSFVVGDRVNDLKAARQIGAKAILVLTGYGRGEYEYLLPDSKVRPDHVADNLARAADWILRQHKKS
jgi:D-glycero-D-manno-heptose 1,7-bisphosphate phosphatase